MGIEEGQTEKLTNAFGNLLSAGREAAETVADNPDPVKDAVLSTLHKQMESLTATVNEMAAKVTAVKPALENKEALQEALGNYAQGLNKAVENLKPGEIAAFAAQSQLSISTTLLTKLVGLDLPGMAAGLWNAASKTPGETEKQKPAQGEELDVMSFINDPVGSAKKAIGKIMDIFTQGLSFASKLPAELGGMLTSTLTQMKSAFFSMLNSLLPSFGISLPSLLADNETPADENTAQNEQTPPTEELASTTSPKTGLDATGPIGGNFNTGANGAEARPEEVVTVTAPEMQSNKMS